MIKFIIKRLLALIPVLVGVSLLVFFILDLAPGDPAKAALGEQARPCLLYTSPSPRDVEESRMPSSA